ncbi:ABC transporter ATP-binding protein [Mobilitalea sibirica]|uniref:ABC transporter ATP-binding protein n=1 Tax=Mobilitalea sibirica TaxID=1462919 RepID=A0A8J7HAY1_9FIRM|nr:ABC transporter ATP-binding protein [Mobilitalea sibirica]MBH1942181.1 ABC transporter ATP-binding protein [Mobilitalea sibirica]
MSLLKVENLYTNYGRITALKGINLELQEGEIISLIGANGAGKSTLLASITGTVPVAKGKIIFDKKDITHHRPNDIVKLGISLSMEGRGVFPRLTVEENLLLGAYTRKNKSEITTTISEMYEMFPRLAQRRKQLAGTMSGGEQQMLAIARALMSKPRLLLLDEPSLGLAPNLVKIIFDMIKDINRKGISILLIEQNANMAMRISNRSYVLENGQVKLHGHSKELMNNKEVRKAYLGEIIDPAVSKKVIQSLASSNL